MFLDDMQKSTVEKVDFCSKAKVSNIDSFLALSLNPRAITTARG